MENNFFQDDNPKRQKLIKPLRSASERVVEAASSDLAAGPQLMALKSETESVATGKADLMDVADCIQNIDQLREYLLTALQLELSTIPPYLCALYTIKAGSSVQAAALIRSIAVEEMLHMILVANLINAITPASHWEGRKLFNVEEIIPVYPTALPGNIVPVVPDGAPPFEVHLRKFSKEALGTFCTIERPSNPEEPVVHQHDNKKVPHLFRSIGQFYQAIRYGLHNLNKDTPGGIFTGDPERQVGPEHYYGSGGKISKVVDCESAEAAIDEIVGQGEGIDGTIATQQVMFGEGIEYAHYFKFQEIMAGRKYSASDTNFQMPVKSVPTGTPFDVSLSAVYNMKANPKMKDYEADPSLLEKARDFNKTYVMLLNNINDAVSGQPDLLNKGIPIMYDLKYKAMELLNIPLGNGECAGPTFEYVPL